MGKGWHRLARRAVNSQANTLVATTQPGDYYAVIYASCENIHVETNHFKIETITAPVFSFNYPDKQQYCDSTSINLQTDYSPIYHYRWYTNA